VFEKIGLSLSGIKAAFSETTTKPLFIAFTLLSGFASLFLLGAASLPDILEGRLVINPFLELSGMLYLAVFSVLVGLAAALHYYKLKKINENGISKTSLAGFFAAMFTTACPACPPVLLSFLGLTTAFAVLPFGGNEIRVLSAFLLLASIYMASLGINKTCPIK